MTEKVVRTTHYSSLGCLGGPLAAMLSVKTWGFTWWLLLHAPLGWFYVIYWVIFLSGWIP